MVDLSTDPDYAHAYDDLTNLQLFGSQDESEESQFFTAHSDSFVVRIILEQKSLCQHRNLFVVDSDWGVTSAVRTEGEEAYYGAEKGGWYQRVDARLRRQKVTNSRLCIMYVFFYLHVFCMLFYVVVLSS